MIFGITSEMDKLRLFKNQLQSIILFILVCRRTVRRINDHTIWYYLNFRWFQYKRNLPITFFCFYETNLPNGKKINDNFMFTLTFNFGFLISNVVWYLTFCVSGSNVTNLSFNILHGICRPVTFSNAWHHCVIDIRPYNINDATKIFMKNMVGKQITPVPSGSTRLNSSSILIRLLIIWPCSSLMAPDSTKPIRW